MAAFGWTHLSRDAIRRAEAQLSDGAAGVRDEVGFLIIHQRYADRFFPGTSVLHTRLRYVLFVPWIYERLREAGSAKSAVRAVQQAEMRLTGRLLDAGVGVIGRQNPKKPASQPPSFVYWTALGTWGLLRRRSDTRPYSRSQIHALIESGGRVVTDDDGVPLQTPELPFVKLPDPPPAWDGDDALDFTLTPKETNFLHGLLTTVVEPRGAARLSLLARLAEAGAKNVPHCWAPEICAQARDDRHALTRAGHAAELAAIGRGVYAAIVETLCENEGRSLSKLHRDYLPSLVDAHAKAAEKLDIDKLYEDIDAIPKPVANALAATSAWVKSGAKNVLDLREVYAVAERWRKDRRARLTNDLSGKERRSEWNNETHALAGPLHYRWGNVRRLIADLHGEP
ncbi:DUF6361 family protein [Methylorubrum aminovorans]